MGAASSAASSVKPSKSLSQEMIKTGNRIGRVAVVLRAMRASAIEKRKANEEGGGGEKKDEKNSPGWNMLKR